MKRLEAGDPIESPSIHGEHKSLSLFDGPEPRGLLDKLRFFENALGRAKQNLTTETNQEERKFLNYSALIISGKVATLKEQIANEHECVCCGIILHISAVIGPECSRHMNRFPCNKFRSAR